MADLGREAGKGRGDANGSFLARLAAELPSFDQVTLHAAGLI